MNRTVACFGISALAVFSTRASPAAAHVGAVAGCYDVDVGEWTVIRGRAAASLAATTPGRIRLDTLLMHRQYDQYRLEPAPGRDAGYPHQERVALYVAGQSPADLEHRLRRRPWKSRSAATGWPASRMRGVTATRTDRARR